MAKLDRNPELPGFWAGVGLGVVGLALILLPPVAHLDMMAYGFALQFLGLFLIIVGLVTALIFGLRARRLHAILAGRNLLVHWVYAPEQHRAQAERDFQEERQRNRWLLTIVAGWLLACVVLFVAIGIWQGHGDDMPLFVGIMAGVLGLVGLFALVMPYVHRRRARRSSDEAYIATDALFIDGVLHTWNGPLARLQRVTLVEDDGTIRLVFHLRSLSRTSMTLYQSYAVEVPVPPGEEATSRRIERHFRQPAGASG